jgi:hypothetical protein
MLIVATLRDTVMSGRQVHAANHFHRNLAVDVMALSIVPSGASLPTVHARVQTVKSTFY